MNRANKGRKIFKMRMGDLLRKSTRTSADEHGWAQAQIELIRFIHGACHGGRGLSLF